MAEIYPSDDELLDLLSESETGVEYIATGTAPYFLQFRKLLYRLLLSTKRANDFRLYNEGGLTYGIKPGRFWDGNSVVDYAGSSGNVLPDDSTRYVYLDETATIQFKESEFWHDPFHAEVWLAEVTTVNGEITSIVDCRDIHSMSMPNVDRPIIEVHTADDQLEIKESGSIHTNLGATGAVTIFMPSFNLAGTKYTVSVQAAQQLNIDPVAGVIVDESGVSSSKYKYCSTVGAFMTVVDDGSGNWIVIGKSGIWTEEA
ncbi:MAG: hypothetical protein FVQ82_08615 [Planctomycetes bacterium]|nr:hypothetical protein [Planctomycetota bacterium]